MEELLAWMLRMIIRTIIRSAYDAYDRVGSYATV